MSKNELKPTYGHLSVQKFLRGLYARTPKRRKGERRRGRGGKRRKGSDRTGQERRREGWVERDDRGGKNFSMHTVGSVVPVRKGRAK